MSASQTHPELAAWHRWMTRSGFKPSTADRHLKNLRGILRRAAEAGHDLVPMELDPDRWSAIRDTLCDDVAPATLRNYDEAVRTWLPFHADDQPVILARPRTHIPMHPKAVAYADSLQNEGGQGKRARRNLYGAHDTTNGPTHAWNKAVMVNRVRASADLDDPDEITREHVVKFLAARHAEARKRAKARGVVRPDKVMLSAQHTVFILTALRDYAAWAGIKDPTKGITRPETKAAVMPLDDTPEPDAVERGIAAADAMLRSDDPDVRDQGRRFKVLLIAGADCGLRVGEALQLSGAPNKINLIVKADGTRLYRARIIPKSKREEEDVAINETLYNLLRAWGGPLYPRSWARLTSSAHKGYRDFRDFANRIGEPSLAKTHGLRRRALVDKLDETGNPVMAQVLARHADLSTTTTYLRSVRGRGEAEPASRYATAAHTPVPADARELDAPVSDWSRSRR